MFNRKYIFIQGPFSSHCYVSLPECIYTLLLLLLLLLLLYSVTIPSCWRKLSEFWPPKKIPQGDPLAFWWDFNIHPRKLTWNLKMNPWKRRFLLTTIIFRFHVSFWEGIPNQKKAPQKHLPPSRDDDVAWLHLKWHRDKNSRIMAIVNLPPPNVPTPPRNEALWSGLINHWFPLIRPY